MKNDDNKVNIEDNNENKSNASYIKIKNIHDTSLKTTNAFQDNKLDEIINKQNNPFEKLKLQIPTYNFSENLLKSIDSSMSSFCSTIGSIVQKQLSIINSNVIEAMTNPLMKVINQIAESQKAMMDVIMSSITVNPLFESLSKSLEEAKANPYSIYNWFEYYDKLSEFFWIMPYKMTPDELHDILSNIKTEKEFDKYIFKYFNKTKVNLLIDDIKKSIERKQDLKLFEQIIIAYNNKSYALASMGLMSIIDNLLSYYLLNKGCTSRVKLFEPIIKDLNRKREINDDFPFIVMMINSNINLLYEDIEFNEKINIKTNKKARRNPVSHGKSYSNKKIDTIMLLNTVYYLLIAKTELKEYKNSLCYDRTKKKFYFPDRAEKEKIKKKIKENINNKKKLVKK